MSQSEIEQAYNPDSNVWDNLETRIREMAGRSRPVDYKYILGDNQALFLGETHFNSSIRRHLVHNAIELKRIGITHYAIEAADKGKPVFDRINKGDQVDLSRVDVGPGRIDYEEVIREMAKQGIKVVPIDIDQSSKPSQERREAHLAQNLLRIFQETPSAKVAVLIGANHTLKVYGIVKNIPSLHQRVMAAGIGTVNAVFTGGEERIPRNITESVVQAGLGNSEFILDMRPYAGLQNVPYGAGEVDFVIHLPQTGSHRDILNRPFGIHLPGTSSLIFGTIPFDAPTTSLYESLLSSRKNPLNIDLKEILKAAVEKGTPLEEMPFEGIEIREIQED